MVVSKDEIIDIIEIANEFFKKEGYTLLVMEANRILRELRGE
jgi:hypothetical protein